MLLQRRLPLHGQKPDRTIEPGRLPGIGGSKRVSNGNIPAQDEVSKSSVSGIEDISDLCKRFKVRDIILATTKYTGITPDQILSARRGEHIVYARSIVGYLSCELTGYSFPVIGRILNRDHTTIIYQHKKITKLLQEDSKTRELIKRIADQLHGEK